MKKLSIILIIMLALVGCNTSGNNETVDTDGKLKVISTFTIITDMVEEIGQDKVSVTNLVPTGTDPHEYEPKPEDIKAITDADLLLYNGLNLEGGDQGWFAKATKSVKVEESKIHQLSDKIEPMYLLGGGDDDEINPHAFISPKNGIKMSEAVRDALVEADAENKDFYEANAETYINKLKEIDEKYHTEIDAIPEENKILVTSEKAFQYMNADYGLREAYIWAIDTEELGTTEQLKSLLEILKTDKPPYLFLESNVDERPMKTISSESGIPIFEKRIYSDEIGTPGSEVDTYLKMLENNIAIISEGLK